MLNTDLKKKLTSVTESTKSTKLKQYQDIVDLSFHFRKDMTNEEKKKSESDLGNLLNKFFGTNDLHVTSLDANNAPTFQIASRKLKTEAVIRIAAIPERSMTAMQILQNNSEQQLFMPETLFSKVAFDQKERNKLAEAGRYPMIAYGNDPVNFSASTFLATTPTSGSLEKLFRDKPVDAERQQAAMKETAETADSLMKMAKLGVFYFDLKDSNVFKNSDGNKLFPDPKSFCDGKSADARFDPATSTWYITGTNDITDSVTKDYAPKSITDVEARKQCPVMQMYSEQLSVMLLRLATNKDVYLAETKMLFGDPNKLSASDKQELDFQLKNIDAEKLQALKNDENLTRLKETKLGDLIKRCVDGEIHNPNVISAILSTNNAAFFNSPGKIDDNYLNSVTKFSKIGLKDYDLGPTITPTLAAESASTSSPEPSPPTRSRSTTTAPAVTHRFSLSSSQSGADLHAVSRPETTSLTASSSTVGSFTSAPKKVGFAEDSSSTTPSSEANEEKAPTPKRRNTLSALATRVTSSRSLPKVEAEPAAAVEQGRKFGNN